MLSGPEDLLGFGDSSYFLIPLTLMVIGFMFGYLGCPRFGIKLVIGEKHLRIVYLWLRLCTWVKYEFYHPAVEVKHHYCQCDGSL